MSGASFRIAFEGEPFRDGEIDVRDLAPSLLALGDVVKAANAALNGERASARLLVKATNDGSFEILLTLDVNWIKDMLDAVAANPDRVIAADRLLELLTKAGFVVGGTVGAAVGFFKAVQMLRGKRPDAIEQRADGSTSITVNRTTFNVEAETLVLLQDVATRESTETFGKKALGVAGIQSLRIGTAGSENEIEFTTNDVRAFDIPEVDEKEPESLISRSEIWLRIVTSQFREGYKWRFFDGGERTFTADMEDTNFLKKALDGSIALSANDALRCRVREEQVVTATGLTKSVFIEEVIEHRPGAKQLKLL